MPPHVDAVRDLHLGSPGVVELCRVEVFGRQTESGSKMDGLGNRLTRQGGFEQSGLTTSTDSGQSGGAMHLKVVWVPIPAGRVVANQHISLFGVQDAGNAGSNQLGWHMREPIRSFTMQA